MESKIISSPFGNVEVPNISLPEFLCSKFASYSDLPALIVANTGELIRFSDLIRRGKLYAQAFRKIGLKHSDVVAVCSQNTIQYLYAMIGVHSVGGIWAPLNPECSEDDSHHLFSLSSPKFVLTNDHCLLKINSVRRKHACIKEVINYGVINQACILIDDFIPKHEVVDFSDYSKLKPTDVAFYMASSGTTGLPKLVELTHATVVANLVQMLHADNPRHLPYNSYHPTTGKPYIHVYPFFHSGGLIFSTLWPLCEGTHLILLNKYEPHDFLASVEKYMPELFIGPPPVLVFMTKSDAGQKANLSSIKTVISGAMPVGQELQLSACNRLKIPYITEGYGLTEASPETHMMPHGKISENKPGSCGVLIAGTEAKILDFDTLEALGPFSTGQLVIRGPQVMKGYLHNIDATQKTISPEGWLHTGDIGYYDEDGFFYVIDRMKDLMSIDGHKVAPAELEHIVISHPGVADAGVTGKKINNSANSYPAAFVVLKAGHESLTEKDIETYVSERVATHKRLVGGVHFIAAIPRAASGKILRRCLLPVHEK